MTSEKANIKDCKVILGGSVTSQHCPLIHTLAIAREKKQTGVPKTNWWRLAEPECRQKLANEATKRLQERTINGTDDWKNVTVLETTW